MANEKKYVSNDNLLYVWQKIKTLLTGKVDKVDGKGLSTNDYTSTEKTKLANIASNAQVNVLEGIQVNGSTVTPTNKIANIDLSSYAKKSDITSVYKLKGNTTWSALIALTTAEVGDVYNVTDKGGANYVCITAKTAGASAWDKLGDTVDLSGYYTSSQVDAKVKAVEDKIPTNYMTTNTYQSVSMNKAFLGGLGIGDGTNVKWNALADSSGNLFLTNGTNTANPTKAFFLNANGTLTYKDASGNIKTFATLDDIGESIEELTNAEIDTIFES